MSYAEEREFGRREKFGRDVSRDNEKSKVRASNTLLRRGFIEQYEEDDFPEDEEYDYFRGR